MKYYIKINEQNKVIDAINYTLVEGEINLEGNGDIVEGFIEVESFPVGVTSGNWTYTGGVFTENIPKKTIISKSEFVDRLNALKEAYYNLKLEDIDIMEMEENLKSANGFEAMRLEIKLEQKRTNRINTEKLVRDCIEEIEDLYGAFKSLPKFTREEFEAEEREHFKLKLARDVSLAAFGGAAGALQSLDNMGENTFAQNGLNNPLFVAQEIEKARKTLKLEVKKDVDRIQ